MGKQLGFLSPRPGLTPGVDSNCSGSGALHQGCVKELKNSEKPKIPLSHVSRVWRLLIAGELVVSTLQTSSLARLHVDENSCLLSAFGHLRQPIPKVNPLEIAIT